MSKHFLFAIFAAALIVLGCEAPAIDNNTEDGPVTKADLIGVWEKGGEPTLTLNENGTYTEILWGEELSGSWDFADGVLTATALGTEGWKATVVLTGGKNWLVLVTEGGAGENAFRSFESFRRQGAKVESGKLTDGRWDATHNGLKPKEYAPDVDYTFNMVIKGNNVDLYVPMWGYHIQGTFTLSDGKMHIETDDDHIWAGEYIEQEGEHSWNISWSAWDSPFEDDPDFDHSYGSMNAETFELQRPYTWYSVSRLLSMGVNPKDYPTEYKNDPYQFKFVIYEYGENIRDNAKDLCDFELCVASNGTEAYGGAVGLSPWIYKR